MRRRMTGLGGAGLLVLLAAGWVLLAPVQLGGQATYLTTDGTSMLPAYHTGDLVVLRRAAEYQVGDVVAYLDPHIGRVFHRIIAQHGDRFLMKGDNNTFVDAYHPTSADVLGRVWVHVPALGSALMTARQPPVAAGLVDGASMLALVTAVPPRKRRRFWHRRAPDEAPDRPPSGGASTGVLGGSGHLLVTLVATLGLVSAILAAVAFSQQLQRSTSATVSYQQDGTFHYTATVPAGVYDSPAVTSGEPAYLSLTKKLTVGFDYHLTSTPPADVIGTASLTAVVTAADGWSRSFVLRPSTTLSGAAVSLGGVLDLTAIQSAIAKYVALAGLPTTGPPGSFVVRLEPDISVTGSVGGAPLTDEFRPQLSFILTPLELQPPAPPRQGDPDPYAPTATGSTTRSTLATNTVPLLFVSPTVSTLRTVSVAGLVIAVLLLIVLLVLLRRAGRADEPARIAGKYGDLLVTLRGSRLGRSDLMFDVASIEDLVRVAEREGRMILHETQGRVHTYHVQDADVTYRYTTAAAAASAEAPEPVREVML